MRKKSSICEGLHIRYTFSEKKKKKVQIFKRQSAYPGNTPVGLFSNSNSRSFCLSAFLQTSFKKTGGKEKKKEKRQGIHCLGYRSNPFTSWEMHRGDCNILMVEYPFRTRAYAFFTNFGIKSPQKHRTNESNLVLR